MWRIILAIGVIMLIIGTLVDGRSPIAAVREAVQPSENTISTRILSDTSNEVDVVETATPQAKTSTPRATATARPSLTPIPTATEIPTQTPLPKKLRFYRKSLDDDPRCVSMQIRGINVTDWTFRVNGTRRVATFDGGGNARMCGFRRGQEFLFTVYNTRNIAVTGGIDIPSKGGAIMIADWQ